MYCSDIKQLSTYIFKWRELLIYSQGVLIISIGLIWSPITIPWPFSGWDGLTIDFIYMDLFKKVQPPGPSKNSGIFRQKLKSETAAGSVWDN